MIELLDAAQNIERDFRKLSHSKEEYGKNNSTKSLKLTVIFHFEVNQSYGNKFSELLSGEQIVSISF